MKQNTSEVDSSLLQSQPQSNCSFFKNCLLHCKNCCLRKKQNASSRQNDNLEQNKYNSQSNKQYIDYQSFRVYSENFGNTVSIDNKQDFFERSSHTIIINPQFILQFTQNKQFFILCKLSVKSFSFSTAQDQHYRTNLQTFFRVPHNVDEMKFNPNDLQYLSPHKLAKYISLRLGNIENLLEVESGPGVYTLQVLSLPFLILFFQFALDMQNIFSFSSKKEDLLFTQHNLKVYKISDRVEQIYSRYDQIKLKNQIWDAIFIDYTIRKFNLKQYLRKALVHGSNIIIVAKASFDLSKIADCIQETCKINQQWKQCENYNFLSLDTFSLKWNRSQQMEQMTIQLFTLEQLHKYLLQLKFQIQQHEWLDTIKSFLFSEGGLAFQLDFTNSIQNIISLLTLRMGLFGFIEALCRIYQEHKIKIKQNNLFLQTFFDQLILLQLIQKEEIMEINQMSDNQFAKLFLGYQQSIKKQYGLKPKQESFFQTQKLEHDSFASSFSASFIKLDFKYQNKNLLSDQLNQSEF